MCLESCRRQPHWQAGEPTSGTLQVWKNAAKPTFSVRSWIARELSALRRPRCSASLCFPMLRSGIPTLAYRATARGECKWFLKSRYDHTVIGTARTLVVHGQRLCVQASGRIKPVVCTMHSVVYGDSPLHLRCGSNSSQVTSPIVYTLIQHPTSSLCAGALCVGETVLKYLSHLSSTSVSTSVSPTS